MARTVLATTEEKPGRSAESLAIPVVLKIVSPDIAHKSDIGGVKVGSEDEDAVVRRSMRSWRMRKGGARRHHHRRRRAADGARRHGGDRRHDHRSPVRPVVMFGLGGIMVEVMKDVSFRVVPWRNATRSR